jgi:hypothetical protein
MWIIKFVILDCRHLLIKGTSAIQSRASIKSCRLHGSRIYLCCEHHEHIHYLKVTILSSYRFYNYNVIKLCIHWLVLIFWDFVKSTAISFRLCTVMDYLKGSLLYASKADSERSFVYLFYCRVSFKV